MGVRLASDFPGGHAKLLRAAEHLAALDTVVTNHLRDDAYSLVIDGDSHVPWTVGTLRVHEAPLAYWGSIIGDVIHNLRAALDHAVYELAERNGCRPDLARTAFPVSTSSETYYAPRGKKGSVPSHRDACLFGLTDAEKAIVDAWQPFQPEPADLPVDKQCLPHPLLMLHRLDNVDKHKTLTAAIGVLEGWPTVLVSPADQAVRVELKLAQPPVRGDEWDQDGAELFRYRTLAKKHSEAHVTVGHVDLRAGFVYEGTPFRLSTLNHLALTVVDLIEELGLLADGPTLPFEAREPGHGVQGTPDQPPPAA